MRSAQTCIGFASFRLQVERLEPRHALASMFVALGPMGGHAPHVGETSLDIVGGSLGRVAAYAPRAELLVFVVGRQLIATHAPRPLIPTAGMGASVTFASATPALHSSPNTLAGGASRQPRAALGSSISDHSSPPTVSGGEAISLMAEETVSSEWNHRSPQEVAGNEPFSGLAPESHAAARTPVPFRPIRGTPIVNGLLNSRRSATAGAQIEVSAWTEWKDPREELFAQARVWDAPDAWRGARRDDQTTVPAATIPPENNRSSEHSDEVRSPFRIRTEETPDLDDHRCEEWLEPSGPRSVFEISLETMVPDVAVDAEIWEDWGVELHLAPPLESEMDGWANATRHDVTPPTDDSVTSVGENLP